MNTAYPKIAVLLPHTRTYGGVRRYIEMGNEFTRRGCDYTIFTPEGKPPDWIPYAGKVKFLEDRAAEVDVLICGDAGMLPRLPEMNARLKVMNLLGPRYAEKYRRHYTPDLVVVGNSLAWKQYLPGVAGYTIPGAVNTSIFRPMQISKTGAPFRVMCFGRRQKKTKGTRFVLKAMRRLRPRRGYLLVMFDNQPQRKPWFLKTERHHALSQEQLARLYNTADVFVSAEYGAGWSNTSAEAMACGVPLVCTDNGTQDFAIDGETALIVPTGDAPAIAAAVKRLHEDEALRKRLAENGLRKIQEFTWPRLCDKFEALFREKGIM